MRTNHYEPIKDIFQSVIDLPLGERPEAVRRACAGDTELAQIVLELLDEDDQRHSLLDASLGDIAEAALRDEPVALLTGRRIARYTLQRLLGEGGMGVVYLATRADIGDSVALKILRDAWMSPMRRERFAREERLLGKLSHPNIARILDADTLEDGTPWFAMEYVDGQPITSYAQSRDTDLRPRLLLFRQVCLAVQFAHRFAIVHRDLKPSNVLVTESGTVKLLDFGIAKVLDDHAGAEHTVEGLRLMTPAYAAPEQLAGGEIGVFTDVYSLGVLLRELLTGEASSADRSGVVFQETTKPSASAKTAKAVSASRHEWADLDVICQTALHPDPEGRYASADALITDLDAFLDGRPLHARRNGFWYATGKFSRRNKTALVVSGLAAVVLALVAIAFTVRLAAARDQALAEVARTQRLQHFTEGLVYGGDPDMGPSLDLSAPALLQRGQMEAESLHEDPRLEADMFSTLGNAYRHLGQLDRADTLLQRALQDCLKVAGNNDKKYAECLMLIGLLRKDQGRILEALATLRKSLTVARSIYPTGSQELARFLCPLGAVLSLHGDYQESRKVLLEAVQAARRQTKPDAALPDSLMQLGEVEIYLGHYPEAKALNNQAMADYRLLYGASHPAVARTLSNLGNIAKNEGRRDEAENLFRQNLAIDEKWYGEKHPQVAADLTSLAGTLALSDHNDEAKALFEKALAIERHAYGEWHSQVAVTLNELGNLAYSRDRDKEAESDFGEALSIWRKVYGENHQFVGLSYANLASIYMDRKDYKVAEQMCRKALAIYSVSLPDEHPKRAALSVKLGRILLRQRRYKEAEQETLRGYRYFASHASGDDSYTRGARKDLLKIERQLNHQDVLRELAMASH